MPFTSPPRLPLDRVPDGEIVVEAPPEVPRAVPANLLGRLLPIALVVAMAGMMVVVFTSGAAVIRNPMFMLFPLMMLASVLGTMTSAGRSGGRTTEINQHRRDYLRYLESLSHAVADTAAAQAVSLGWSHPEPGSLWTLVGTTRMWERRGGDSDFGHVRVGCGRQRLSTKLVAPALGPVEELDPVTSMALRRLIRTHSFVPDLPIALAVHGFAAITIDGDAAAARGLARAMVCQLAVLHSPQRLKVVAAVGRNRDWDWLKWLPHNQHPDAVDAVGSARMLYSSVSDAEAALDPLIADRGAFTWPPPPEVDESPHVVMIVDGGQVAGSERCCTHDGIAGVTVLEIGIGCDELAARHGLRMTISADRLAARGAIEEVFARPDTMTPVQALVCARRMAPFRPASGEGDDVDLSRGAARWQDLLNLGDPAVIDPAAAWRDRGARNRLRVPIGVTEHGTAVELDIKEAALGGMGPHGLCVGATGSGKSEFLRTLTLGMITRHAPDVLNLILVDFKGGATFLGLERAAHVAAVITNLSDEAHLVARMKDALAGEMHRRQELLRAAGNYANVADYERARQAGTALAPLAALLIVIDEFSELLSQHPDFAELFVAIGRLGRSLGIHLLLASQRLDEGRLRGLETHLSYRVCLKTFAASESRAAIGVPDAYHLPSTPGAAYLRNGSADLTRFQTSFVSGPCVTRRRSDDGAPMASSTTPLVFTAAAAGPLTRPTGDESRIGPSTGTARTVLETVLDRLQGRGGKAHSVWLPPLAESPTLDALIPRRVLEYQVAGTLSVPIGLVDRPFEQRRDVLLAELSGAGGNVAIVGAPGSGKSMALRTLTLGLAATHRPGQVQFYCLDFGGGSLSSLRSLPHVGAVAGRSDPDLVRRTIAELESVVRTREARFRRHGIDSLADFRQRRAAGDPSATDDPFGDVFLVIDGWGSVRQEFENLEAPITALAAQGLSFGLHVVVAASRWAEIRPGLKDQIGTRIELRLGDPSDSEIDRKRARRLADVPPGRGITRDGRDMVIALPRFDGKSTSTGIGDAIAAKAQFLRARFDGQTAPPVRLLPSHVDDRDVMSRSAEPQSATRLLLGLGERDLRPVALDFAEQAHLVILGDVECGKTAALRMLCRQIIRTNSAHEAQLMVVDCRRTLLGVVESGHLTGYAISADALASQMPALLDRLRDRMPGNDVTQQQLRARSWWSGPEIYVVIDDYDLVATATGNPLTAMVEFLPHAKDLGLHLIVARRSGGAARAMFDPVLARLRDLGSMGLIMSANPEEGILLGSVRSAALPPGRGTLITRSNPDQLIQVAWTAPQ